MTISITISKETCVCGCDSCFVGLDACAGNKSGFRGERWKIFRMR